MKRDAPAVGGRSRQSSGPPGQGPRAQQLRSIAGEAAPRAKARSWAGQRSGTSCSRPSRFRARRPVRL